MMNAEQLVENAFPNRDPDTIDTALVVAFNLLESEIPVEGGVAYRGHHFVRAEGDRLAYDVFRGTRLIDRVYPIQIGSARAVGEYVDRVTSAELSEQPPIDRQAFQQRRDLQ